MSEPNEHPDIRQIGFSVEETIDYENSYISPAALEYFKKFPPRSHVLNEEQHDES